ncbi:MAG: flagellar filament capping protein FliD [Acidobacteriota bacterium]|nr:flagellar filament capping protein FliD [Acidobacteriota bacterium]
MGTVGLSFGSPMGGTGFDVSATVASIVSNLQSVETPWKNQLASLESQDAVMSNLGSLFSNLSNDLSQLTDFQGVLAQKTGSSSDTNVLELTAATSTATAGTHTVVVNNLAQTSSGYLTPVTNSSDTLSGSITIQVGSGTAQTVTLGSSNNTLSGLAAAINSASIGVTASVLTDSSGSRLSLVSGTSGANGNLGVTSSITDTSNANASLSYTSAVTGTDASLTVDGINLTSASNTVTNLIPGVTFQLLAPSATGSQVQVVIGNYNTGVESAINSMVTDYNSLISAINTQEGNDSSGNSEPLYGSPTLSLLQQQLLGGLNTQNPNGYLDAITNTSDTLSGSITIQVGSGTAQTVTLNSTDNTISGLASAINAANIGVTANLVTDSAGTRLTLVSGTAGSSGALTVTAALTDVTNSNTALNYNANSSDISGLTSLGISVNNDGSLNLNTTSLDSLLNSDFSGVVGFFQDANSWGMTFSNMLTNAGTTSSTGVLKLAENANSTVESNLNADISREGSMISVQQKLLTAELNSANEILQALPAQLNSVNEIYSAMTGYNPNKG